jgi:hypothetical protein
MILHRYLTCAVVALLLFAPAAARADEPQAAFRAGFARRDITPEKPVPMWGYGGRHDALSQGTLDPLFAEALVIEAAGQRLAIMGIDLGRGPTTAMMAEIRKQAAERSGVQHVLIGGSHTHHAPVIELTDRPGFGKGRFDDAVAYSRRLPELLVEAIAEAAERLQPARFGVAGKELAMNRNRHTRRMPKPVDPLLSVVRLDGLEGRPIAVVVNFAAHPVMTPAQELKFSADYPGYLKRRVVEKLGGGCVFMQGASGDLSPNPGERRGPQAFGEALGDQAVELAQAIQSEAPRSPSIQCKVDAFEFKSRVDFNNPLVTTAYSAAFFPELVRSFVEEFRGSIRPELSTALVNGELAIVAGSGEFFANHAVRLRARSYASHTQFFGYANGHHMYFPTIEAASEGGYGGDPTVSPVEIGAGERMMDRALVNLYTFLGKFPPGER